MDVIYFDEDVKSFVTSFQIGTRSKIVRTIELLSEYEYRLGMPHSRMVESGLYELRIRGKPEVRLFYTFDQNKAVILFGYVKKTQKIPKSVIDTFGDAKLRALARRKKRRSVSTLSIPRSLDRGVERVDLIRERQILLTNI